MITLDSTFKDNNFRRWLKKAPHIAQDIVESGINAVTMAVSNYVPGATESEWNVDFRDAVKQKIQTVNSGGWITSTILYKGKRTPFIKLNPNPSSPETDMRSGGVAVQIKRGENQQFRRAFVARMNTGHVGVFERTGNFRTDGNRKRETIKELSTVAVPQMIASENLNITDDTLQLAQDTFDRVTSEAIAEWLKTTRGKL